MSKKYSTTCADYLIWDQMTNLVRKLFDDQNYKMCLLVAIGSFWGLRISDILALRWSEVLEKDSIEIIEKKTKKKRIIAVNPQLKQLISDCYNRIKPLGIQSHIFLSQKGSVYSIQRINIILKQIKVKYKLDIHNFSTHTFRKTMGRQVLTLSGENAEFALIKLMEIYNHQNLNTTKRYLGLKAEEIKETYELLSF